MINREALRALLDTRISELKHCGGNKEDELLNGKTATKSIAEEFECYLKFNPNQPRVPAGNPHGGEWTSGGSTSGGGALSDNPVLEKVTKKIISGEEFEYDDRVAGRKDPEVAAAFKIYDSVYGVGLRGAIEESFKDPVVSKTFDKMASEKDYPLYRVDSRFTVDNVKVGETIKFSDRPYHASREKEQAQLAGSIQTKAVLKLEQPTSLKFGFSDELEKFEMVRGNFLVKSIDQKTNIITLSPVKKSAKTKKSLEEEFNTYIKNCGTGAGGFKQGNTCARSGGASESAYLADRKTEPVKLGSGYGTINVDEAIASTVKDFNKNGLQTFHSCSGHECTQSLESQISYKVTPKGEKAHGRLATLVDSKKLNLEWELEQNPFVSSHFELRVKGGFYSGGTVTSTKENVKAAVADFQTIRKVVKGDKGDKKESKSLAQELEECLAHR